MVLQHAFRAEEASDALERVVMPSNHRGGISRSMHPCLMSPGNAVNHMLGWPTFRHGSGEP